MLDLDSPRRSSRFGPLGPGPGPAAPAPIPPPRAGDVVAPSPLPRSCRALALGLLAAAGCAAPTTPVGSRPSSPGPAQRAATTLHRSRPLPAPAERASAPPARRGTTAPPPLAAEAAEGSELSISEPQAVAFEHESARLPAAAATLLDRLAPMLRHSTVRLTGHADRSEREAAVLSLERARAVQRYLISRGVPAERLEISALAATHPSASSATAEGRAENRRVELIPVGED